MSVAKVNFAQVIITEIDPNGQRIEIYNPTDNLINLQAYRFGTLGNSFTFASLTLLPPKQYLSLSWPHLNHNLTEFYIYKINQFNTDGFIDYVRIGNNLGNVQIGYANQAGVWNNGFTPVIPVEDPMSNPDYLTLNNLNLGARTGHDTNSTTWGFAKNSLGFAPLCSDQSFQGPVRFLTTNDNGQYYDYEAEVPIHSSQILQSTSIVDYDSSEEILLVEEFEVLQGAIFHAFIDGCGFGDNGELF